MYQSARTKIIMVDGRTEICDFPIPFGGSGTDFEERKAWVKKRVEMSFGTDPAPIFTMLDNPDTPISEFVKFCSKRIGN
jgi:hypothetical protein